MIGSKSIFPTLSILLLSVWAKTAQSFQCYTGDGRVMRRKTCPTLGDMKFTDLCFKTYGTGPEIQRGCFNKQLLEIIMMPEEGDSGGTSGGGGDGSLTSGCTKFPEKFGEGTICVCDTSLCNTSVAQKPSKYSLAAALLLTVIMAGFSDRFG